MTAPGISLNLLLSKAPDSALKSYIGAATTNIVSALCPDLLTHENLVRLAEEAFSPMEVMRSRELRSRVIDLLPLAKAEELSLKLGIESKGSNLYRALKGEIDARGIDSEVLSFFGIVEQERAPDIGTAPKKEITPTYGLFPHQIDVADRALEVLRHEPHTAIIHMPTGAGKTRTAMHIVARVLNRHPDRLVIWLAQTAELLEQAAEEFEKAWSSLGSYPAKVYRFWGDHEPDIVEARNGFLVAGFGKLQGLWKRDANMIMRLGDRIALLIVDEAHQAVAPTYRRLIDFIYGKQPSNSLLGLTATPGRTWANIAEDAELSAMFHNKKVMLKIEGYLNPIHYLISEGYIAKPTFNTLNVAGGFNPAKADLEYLSSHYDIPERIISQLATDEQRNIQIIKCIEDLTARHSRIILFAATVGHAHLISSILNLRGTKSFVVTGETEKPNRERALFKFKSSDPHPIVMTNFGVLTTGFDAPRTSAAIIARPTRSLVLYSQMVGRAIRGVRAGGNLTAEIVTVVDPQLPGFGDLAEAFANWEDVWNNV